MDFLSSLLCFLVMWVSICFLLSIAKESLWSHGKLPPGPFPFPLVGDLFKLGKKPHKSLAELAKVHGPIMTLKLGSITTILISSPSMAKEVLQTKDLLFANRKIKDAVRAHNHNEVSVIWLPISPKWRNLRKICNSEVFASQKLDSIPMQDLRCQKVRDLIAYVQECCEAGIPVNIGRAVFSTSLNLISYTLFSVDLADPSSDDVREFKELVWGIMDEAGKKNFADYFPILQKIDPQGIRSRMTSHFGKIIKLIDTMISARLVSREGQDSTETNDVLDTLLSIIDEKIYEINLVDIRHLLLDLFAAGTDTTSNTLEWAMAELLHNPAVMSKARQEIEQTIGKGNPVEESDIAQLPYLQAIVKETLRLHPPAPLLVPRRTESEIEVCGYVVPKKAQVLINAWAIGRDPSTWVNPNSFIPERFLGSEVDVKGHHYELIPFGAGRRICPGLPLALRMIPLMLASLIHLFEWELEDGMRAEDMDMEDKFAFNLRKAVPMCAIPIRV